MDFQRLILISALAFTLLLMWNAWQQDYGPRQPTDVPVAQQPRDTPVAPQDPAVARDPAAPPRVGIASAQRITVQTDLYHAEIDTRGGDLRRVDLLEYPVDPKQPNEPVTLLNDQGTDMFIAQSGLLPAASNPDTAAPTHHTVFEAQQTAYRLEPGQDTLSVPLTWRDASGVLVTKTYTFHRGDYVVDVGHTIDNASPSPWQGRMYQQLLRSRPADGGPFFIYTYTGGVIYGADQKYQKIDFDDMDETNLSASIKGGWGAMIQHYFLSAWIPPADQTSHYYTIAPGENRYILGMQGPDVLVAAGQSTELGARLYVGPKLQDHLAEVAPGLELTVDYGMLTIISKPLFWLLDFIHGIVGNWGWAIVFVTLLIKLAFFKLSATSYKSMAHMRKMQPRLLAIKERYGDDRQKLNEAMMKMYREEKINPLGGCLPILVQIPVFIALYWVLLESVELRQADFMLWINDLSSADPYFVLPVLMGVTMLLQHRLNPTPMDPIQAKVMMVLPIVFTVFFAFFPAGLVLYWVVNNTLSIAQQWYITRHVVKA